MGLYCRVLLCLKSAFMTAPILTHWVPNAPLVVETDASDYAIAGILSIGCSNGEFCLVTFYSCTLTLSELNYDTHDKELLAIFEVFQHWCHYLEGSASPINVMTDHKNLEYFTSSKLLTRQQACLLEFLHQFNLLVHFHPGHLGVKPDALTHCWDVYPKEGDRDYARVNPHNFQSVFLQEQLTSSLRATYLLEPILHAASLIDVDQLHKDILSALSLDPVATKHMSDTSNPRWSVNSDGFLCLDSRIYIPDTNDLRLRLLRFKHDHPLTGHFGQNRTLELLHREYTWPGIHSFIKEYVRSCINCARATVP